MFLIALLLVVGLSSSPDGWKYERLIPGRKVSGESPPVDFEEFTRHPDDVLEELERQAESKCSRFRNRICRKAVIGVTFSVVVLSIVAILLALFKVL